MQFGCLLQNYLLFAYTVSARWDLLIDNSRGSIPGHVIPKTLKMVLVTNLINTQQYKVRIKGKVEQSRERSSTILYM